MKATNRPKREIEVLGRAGLSIFMRLSDGAVAGVGEEGPVILSLLEEKPVLMSHHTLGREDLTPSFWLALR